MDETTPRRVMSNEEFLAYEDLQNLEKQFYGLIALILRDRFQATRKECAELLMVESYELNSMMGESYEKITKEYVFHALPETVREVFLKFQETLNQFSSVEEIRNALSDEQGELSSQFEEVRQAVEGVLEEAAQIISKSDLSQVAPESFYSFSLLDSINFENTGARLDIKNIKRGAVVGSIKGCQLLSYDRFHHHSQKGTYESGIKPELLDESQYLKVLESQLMTNYPYLNPSFCFLMESQEIQDQMQYMFDAIVMKDFESKDMGSTLYILFNLMSPETRERNRAFKDKMIALTMEESLYNVRRILPLLDMEAFQKYHDVIMQKCGGKYDKESVWKGLNLEIQRTYFDEFEKEIGTEATIKGAQDELKEEKIAELIETKRTPETGKLNLMRVSQLLNTYHYLPEKYFDELFNEESLFRTVTDYQGNQKKELDYHLKNIWSDAGKRFQSSKLNEIANLCEGKEALFFELWRGVNPDIQVEQIENIMERFDLLHQDADTFRAFWKKTYHPAQKEVFEKIVGQLDETSPLYHDFMGEYYLELINNGTKIDKEKTFQEEPIRVAHALLEYFQVPKTNWREEEYESYPVEIWKVLFDLYKDKRLTQENAEVIINNIQKLGKDFIMRIINSNSDEISQNAGMIISNLPLESTEATEKALGEIENIFSKNNLPDFVKLYKYFELVEYDQMLEGTMQNKFSQALIDAGQTGLRKRIIFSDLLRIGLESNNKSMNEFLEVLEKGNEVYKDVVLHGKDPLSLSVEEKQLAHKYIETLYALYEISGPGNRDKVKDSKIVLTGDIKTDFLNLGSRYVRDGKVENLPDQVLATFMGPYQELLGGIDTVQEMKQYRDERIKEANARHRKLAEELIETGKLTLEEGDLVKGVKKGKIYAFDIMQNGIRAGEFLKTNSHSDVTPLDTDFSRLLAGLIKESLDATLQNSSLTASSYGNGTDDFYIILKHQPGRIETTRRNDSEELQNENLTLAEKMAGKQNPEIIKKRIEDRANHQFDDPKLEVFGSGGTDHYGIRTGISATDIDYIVLKSRYDKRIGYAMALAGIYIPVVDARTEQVVFTPEDYDKLRQQMRGLSSYGAEDFVVDPSAYVDASREIVQMIYPDETSAKSQLEIASERKREAIQYQIQKSLGEKLGLEVFDHITGDVTEGFIELIDTGSTGRGTNMPGDGDFDFTLKLDKRILEDPQKLGEFKQALKEVLAVKYPGAETELDEVNGNFRYKNVKVEGLEEPVSIDITFTSKTERVSFSTDMAIKERLDNIRATDSEGYKCVVANIIMAKQMLKREGLYKKEKSQGATEFGGFGGSGVENWILQNGGSFVAAIDSFMEAAEQAKSFEEFREIYPIFDFGQNHVIRDNQHDSFIMGLTAKGFEQMKKVLPEIKEKLSIAPEKVAGEKSGAKKTSVGEDSHPGDSI